MMMTHAQGSSIGNSNVPLDAAGKAAARSQACWGMLRWKLLVVNNLSLQLLEQARYLTLSYIELCFKAYLEPVSKFELKCVETY